MCCTTLYIPCILHTLLDCTWVVSRMPRCVVCGVCVCVSVILFCRIITVIIHGTNDVVITILISVINGMAGNLEIMSRMAHLLKEQRGSVNLLPLIIQLNQQCTHPHLNRFCQSLQCRHQKIQQPHHTFNRLQRRHHHQIHHQIYHHFIQ